jgi:hypothetical protein
MAKNAKSDDGSTGGIKSISNSAKNKGKKLAKEAKLGLVKKHGGCCLSCGQTSTSATPSAPHLGCKGFFQGDFKVPALNKLAEQSQSPMLADGSPIHRPVEGFWGDPEVLTKRRAERAQEAERLLRKQVHIIPIDKDGNPVPASSKETVSTRYENGMGDPITYHEGAWREVVEPEENDPIPPELVDLTEDPGLTEKVSTDEDALAA